MTIKNIDSRTPLDECCDTNKDEIISLFSKYNPKRGELISNKYVVVLLLWFVVI